MAKNLVNQNENVQSEQEQQFDENNSQDLAQIRKELILSSEKKNLEKKNEDKRRLPPELEFEFEDDKKFIARSDGPDMTVFAKAKAYDERLKYNEIVHKADNVNQDYAHNKEIMKKLPKQMPEKVRANIEKRLDKEAHVDSTSSMDMEKDIVNYHKQKTSEMIKHIGRETGSKDINHVKDNPSVQKLMDKYEQDFNSYQERQIGDSSILEKVTQKY